MSIQPTSAVARKVPQLPLELVAAVMRVTEPEDLRNMAASCRQYKSTAYHHAGLLLYASVSVSLPPDQRAVQRVAECRDIVRHASKHELRLDLTLRYSFSSERRPSQSDISASEMHCVADMCAILSEALPVVVNLNLVVPDILRATVDTALSHTAPHLRLYILSAIAKNGAPCGLPVSDTIFAGSAPKLRRVQFWDVHLGDVAIPAFAAVREVELQYTPVAPPVRISTVFPAVRHLELICIGTLYDPSTATLRFDLAGLALHKLSIFDDEGYYIHSNLDPPTVEDQVPVLFHDNRFSHLRPEFWAAVSGPLTMRIVDQMRGSDFDTFLTIATEGRAYARIYKMHDMQEVESEFEDELECLGLILDPGSLAPRFVYIRLDQKYLRDIYKFKDSLAALRRLQIDVYDAEDLAPDQEDPAVIVPCPVLDNLVIFALEEQLQMHCAEMASLALVLGLEDDRATGPVLTLAGVDFGGESSSSLEAVFSRIVLRPFRGRGSPDDLENGFWEY